MKTVFILFFLNGFICFSQNLVPNHDYSLISSNVPFLSYLIDWNAPLAPDGQVGLPGHAHDTICTNPQSLIVGRCPGLSVNNATYRFTTPYPYEGKGITLHGLYYDSIVNNFYTQNGIGLFTFHSAQLSQMLMSDTNYCTEVHVMLATGKMGGSELCQTAKGFGLYFADSNYLPSINPWNYGVVPQVGGYDYFLNDSTWTKLKGSFIASGQEEYIIIGNFSPYSQPPLQFLNHPNCGSSMEFGAWLDAVYVYNCRDTLFKVVQKDTTVCWGQPVQLQPDLRGFKLQDTVRSYHWQTPGGTTTTADSTFTATAQGNYTVTVTLNKRFTATTNFTITWVPEAPDTALLPDSVALCPNEPQQLVAPEIPGARYRWSNGDTTRFTTIGLPGLYTLQVITPCWLHTENVLAYQSPCGTRIFIPNAFTPDGDGTNDTFAVFGPIQPFTLIITDRWGKVVYQSQDYQNDWDGTYQGEPLPTGVYSYRIIYAKYAGGPKNYDEVGTVTLIR